MYGYQLYIRMIVTRSYIRREGVDEGGGSIISGELRGWEGEVGSGKG